MLITDNKSTFYSMLLQEYSMYAFINVDNFERPLMVCAIPAKKRFLDHCVLTTMFKSEAPRKCPYACKTFFTPLQCNEAVGGIYYLNIAANLRSQSCIIIFAFTGDACWQKNTTKTAHAIVKLSSAAQKLPSASHDVRVT